MPNVNRIDRAAAVEQVLKSLLPKVRHARKQFEATGQPPCPYVNKADQRALETLVFAGSTIGSASDC